MEPVWPDAEPEEASIEPDGAGDEPPAVEPGSDLFRRLMILRRLVRQRIYNEGFPPDATPEQYLRASGQDDLDSPFSAQ